MSGVSAIFCHSQQPLVYLNADYCRVNLIEHTTSRLACRPAVSTLLCILIIPAVQIKLLLLISSFVFSSRSSKGGGCEFRRRLKSNPFPVSHETKVHRRLCDRKAVVCIQGDRPLYPDVQRFVNNSTGGEALLRAVEVATSHRLPSFAVWEF